MMQGSWFWAGKEEKDDVPTAVQILELYSATDSLSLEFLMALFNSKCA